MNNFNSLKFTIPILLVTIMGFYLAVSWLVITKVNDDAVIGQAIHKTKEVAHKIAHDVEVVLKLSDSVYDINNILVNYLLGDINYIAVYDTNDSLLYESHVKNSYGQQEQFFKQYGFLVREKNIVKEELSQENSMILNMIPFAFPPKENEILSKEYGIIYFEYDLDYDLSVMQNNSKKLLLIYIIGNILLVLVIIYFAYQRIINRIVDLSKGTKAITNGFLDYRLQHEDKKHLDELDMVFDSFNVMAESLSDKEDKVKMAYDALMQKTYEAKRANAAKSEFLANMSHEIRTPLNAMLGFIQLLEKKEDNKERLKYFNVINEASHNLMGIINDILDFSKIESGKLEIDLHDFDPRKEFGTIFELYRQKADEKSLSFNLTMDERLPSALLSDPLRLKQVIGNLLSNAVKFSKVNGSIGMHISFDAKNEQLKVVIKDDGIGIEDSKQAHIFKAFTQSDSSITRKYGGTGLGLSISYQLIEMLGGKLSFTSVYDQGTTFSFYVPAKIGEKAVVKKEEGAVTFSGQRVLLVEDNKSNQMLMSILLDDFNLDYDIANDGQEAINKFQSSYFDLILMDENMPKMNGIEATRQIRIIEKETNAIKTPIIALTANVLKGDRERFLASGMDEYLSKPVDKIKLQSILKHFISLKESNKDLISTKSALDIKKESLSALFGLSPEDITELLTVFYDNAKKEILKMQKAIRLNNYVEITRSAHAIKGSAANLRLDEIAKSAEIVEQAAKKEETIEYTWYYEQLDNAIEKIL